MDVYGYVYCMTNKNYPNKCKIGFTTKTPQERAKQLYNTSIPDPFNVEFFIYVKNPEKYEAIIHNKLEQYRYNKDREFFTCEPNDVEKYFKIENLIKNDIDKNDFQTNYFNNHPEIKQEKIIDPELRKQQKQQNAEIRKQEKQREAELRKQQKQREIELRKQQKQKEIELRKQEKQREIELRKQEKQREAEIRKQEKQREIELRKQEKQREAEIRKLQKQREKILKTSYKRSYGRASGIRSFSSNNFKSSCLVKAYSSKFENKFSR